MFRYIDADASLLGCLFGKFIYSHAERVEILAIHLDGPELYSSIFTDLTDVLTDGFGDE